MTEPVNVKWIVNSAGHPWCKEGMQCYQFFEGEIDNHPEWKQLLGSSGNFSFKLGQMFQNGLFIGKLYTVNDNTSTAYDGLVFGRAKTVDNQVRHLPILEYCANLKEVPSWTQNHCLQHHVESFDLIISAPPHYGEPNLSGSVVIKEMI